VNSGKRFREKITFTPMIEVLFERVDTEENAGWITNVISEGEHGLLLTFTFAVNVLGVAPSTPEERAKGGAMGRSYVGAVNATLARVRQLVSEGKWHFARPVCGTLTMRCAAELVNAHLHLATRDCESWKSLFAEDAVMEYVYGARHTRSCINGRVRD
jgi:hypothetical protein